MMQETRQTIQGICNPSDNNDMNISGVNSIGNILSGMSTAGPSGGVPLQVSVAVMKSLQDQQKALGEQLVKMIESMPTPAGTGQIINKSA